MSLRLAGLLALVLLLSPGASPAGPHAAVPEPCVATARGGVAGAASFELDGNHIYLDARVEGRGPYDFILDSGATVTAVDAALARRLRRPVRASGTTRGAGAGSIRIGRLPGTDVTVAGLQAGGSPAMAMPVDSIIGPFAGRRTHGVGGFPFFRGRVVEVDFAGRCVRVHRPEGFHPSPDALVLPMEVRGGWPHVDATLELPDGRRVPADLMVDTGSRMSLILTTGFVRRQELLASVPERVRGTVGAGVGGEARFDLARIPALLLDTLRYAEPVVGFSTGGGLDLSAFDGVLGTELLRRFRVHFDYAGGRLILEPGADRHRPEEFDMSGLVLVAPPGKNHGRGGDEGRPILVHRVAPDTPADDAGLAAGDRILSVDGRPADSLSLGRVEEMLEGPAGAERTLTVGRDGRTLTVTLTLERLI